MGLTAWLPLKRLVILKAKPTHLAIHSIGPSAYRPVVPLDLGFKLFFEMPSK